LDLILALHRIISAPLDHETNVEHIQIDQRLLLLIEWDL
jgi:hypothetical protein